MLGKCATQILKPTASAGDRGIQGALSPCKLWRQKAINF